MEQKWIGAEKKNNQGTARRRTVRDRWRADGLDTVKPLLCAVY